MSIFRTFAGLATRAADTFTGGLASDAAGAIGLTGGGGDGGGNPFTVAHDGVQPPQVNPVLAYVERFVPGYASMDMRTRQRAFKDAFKAGRFRGDPWLTSLGDDGKKTGELKAWTDLAEMQGGWRNSIGRFPGRLAPPSPPPILPQPREADPAPPAAPAPIAKGGQAPAPGAGPGGTPAGVWVAAAVAGLLALAAVVVAFVAPGRRRRR